jgi:xanthine dehydrogenase accessory factor
MSELFREIDQALSNGQELAVATIISDGGSTPRTSGSKMIVYPNSDISGTIGGGAVEGDVIQRALRLFKNGEAEIVSCDLSRNDNLHRMDVICGGRMRVLIEHVAAHEKNLELYHAAIKEVKRSRSFFWIGKITDDDGQQTVERAIQKSQDEFTGPPELKHEFEKLAESGTRIINETCFIEFQRIFYVIESVIPPDTLFLCGAGHVSKEIAILSKRVGFSIIVFDDRAEFANADRFPDADEILNFN